MCGTSSVGSESKTWCGSGWTGQPAVCEQDGKTLGAFGAYDKDIHFLDAADGAEIIGSFGMGDIIKGSVTQDPDGSRCCTPAAGRTSTSSAPTGPTASPPTCGAWPPPTSRRPSGTTTGTARR